VKGKDAEARRDFGNPVRWLHGEEPCICHHANDGVLSAQMILRASFSIILQG